MVSVCLSKLNLKRISGAVAGAGVSLTLVSNAFAQTFSTGSSTLTDTTTKGGTTSSLPSAGTSEITYAIFAIGVALFVLGAMKLAKSFR